MTWVFNVGDLICRVAHCWVLIYSCCIQSSISEQAQFWPSLHLRAMPFTCKMKKFVDGTLACSSAGLAVGLSCLCFTQAMNTCKCAANSMVLITGTYFGIQRKMKVTERAVVYVKNTTIIKYYNVCAQCRNGLLTKVPLHHKRGFLNRKSS